MGKYNEKEKDRSIRYIKDKLQRLEVRYQKEEYESRIRPAIEKSGKPVATFIKEAIDEKIERDGLLDADGEVSSCCD